MQATQTRRPLISAIRRIVACTMLTVAAAFFVGLIGIFILYPPVVAVMLWPASILGVSQSSAFPMALVVWGSFAFFASLAIELVRNSRW